MTGLWDAERDASEVAQALSGLAALLREGDGADPRVLRSLAENGGAAAERVVAYLRRQCAPGDGEMVAVPPRLAAWRDWVPPRGHLFGVPGVRRQSDGVPQPRRCGDPGE
ncbi:hypothetical protein [Actinoplanes xinjiangensis]|jgi:hypothetical protein|uniref:Uncharacterized protein n=1 Tax=Actinoplanes xinjiangensis TaxID=512350 RepID=A0A316FNU1_9ACTN|nr:hypothetical protein [Actinoplanes xinjiangensis]PWK50538.1 hypothetical protein BC793_103424 [Actinoplanes xinjiangensis]GIF36427.1 hypothetical protein Axi01nite_07380 [Actinoplanes xinjiangensis]